MLQAVEKELVDPLENLQVKVIKRDGRVTDFQKEKIYVALKKANEESAFDGTKLTEQEIGSMMKLILTEIASRFHQDIKIYEIQNIVEHTLITENKFALAQAYINYRTQRDFERKKATDIYSSIEKLVNKDRTVVNENANKDSETFHTQRDLTAGIVAKSIGIQMLPAHVANAHQKGEIHIHDLDYHPYQPMTNCCLIDFHEMLNNGFQIGNAQVESPKSIQTATAQMAQIIANVASSQFGGCSADRVDELLAPFALKNYEKHMKTAAEWIEDESKHAAYAKKKTKKDIYDAMQSLEYEINTLYSSQGQTPFTTLGFGLGTSWVEREIQKAILEVRLKGIGVEQRTAIFPKLVFTLKRGLNLEENDPNYDMKQLAIECATKRMYPDVLNYDKVVELTGSFKVPMGCRSFLQGWKDEHGNEVNAGRANLGVITLNLPRIAMESKGSKEIFWQLLMERLDIVRDGLIYRIDRIKEAKPQNAPILYKHGVFGKRLEDDADVNDLFKNRRATISLGYIGLYEVATVFYGGEWESNPEAKAFTLEILKLMKANTTKWADEYNYHFSVYATPSESLTDRFCRMDKEKFGSVKDITDKDYYTNGFHYDVRKKPNPFEKLDFESEYPTYASGGFIHYCEYPNMRHNPKALEAVWDYAYDRVGYLGTNTPIDHCYECGYSGDFDPTERGFQCPSCGNDNPETCDVVKRTCGYLGNPQARPMAHGRHKEIAARKKHI